MDKEDERLQLASLLTSSIPYLNVSNNYYVYPNIPVKYNKAFEKYYDPDIDFNEVIAFIDATVMNSGKNGMLFMLHGFYFSDTFQKTKYINYKDITSIIMMVDKKGNDGDLEIVADENLAITVMKNDSFYSRSTLEQMFEVIKNYTDNRTKNNDFIKPNGLVRKKQGKDKTGFLQGLQDLNSTLETINFVLGGKTEEQLKKEAEHEEDMKAKGYVYNSAFDIWLRPGEQINKVPRLFDKDGREIRPFTPDDFNRGRPKR